MSMRKTVTNTMVAGAVAMALGGLMATNAEAAANDKEKCFGVVKAGHNDCADAKKSHSCMGHATVDGDDGEWIALPKGICEKLVGGSLTPIEGEAEEAPMEDKEG